MDNASQRIAALLASAAAAAAHLQRQDPQANGEGSASSGSAPPWRHQQAGIDAIMRLALLHSAESERTAPAAPNTRESLARQGEPSNPSTGTVATGQSVATGCASNNLMSSVVPFNAQLALLLQVQSLQRNNSSRDQQLTAFLEQQIRAQGLEGQLSNAILAQKVTMAYQRQSREKEELRLRQTIELQRIVSQHSLCDASTIQASTLDSNTNPSLSAQELQRNSLLAIVQSRQLQEQDELERRHRDELRILLMQNAAQEQIIDSSNVGSSSQPQMDLLTQLQRHVSSSTGGAEIRTNWMATTAEPGLLQQQSRLKNEASAPTGMLLSDGIGVCPLEKTATMATGFRPRSWQSEPGAKQQEESTDSQKPAAATSSTPTNAAFLDTDPSTPSKRKGRPRAFPRKLFQMLVDLEEQNQQDIAVFLPHGKAFVILKPDEFVKEILPKYFKMKCFSSFQRQLNLYAFQRINGGPDKGAYFHKFFVKGEPELCDDIHRVKGPPVLSASAL